MKTLAERYKSQLNLEEYLTSPCEIDRALSNYLRDVVPPSYMNDGLLQCGEPYEHTPAGIPCYSTVSYAQ